MIFIQQSMNKCNNSLVRDNYKQTFLTRYYPQCVRKNYLFGSMFIFFNWQICYVEDYLLRKEKTKGRGKNKMYKTEKKIILNGLDLIRSYWKQKRIQKKKDQSQEAIFSSEIVQEVREKQKELDRNESLEDIKIQNSCQVSMHSWLSYVQL